MSNHTPGPWRVNGRYIEALKIKVIAEVPRAGVIHGRVDAANARLIAAAPKLQDEVDRLRGIIAASLPAVLNYYLLTGGQFAEVLNAMRRELGGPDEISDDEQAATAAASSVFVADTRATNEALADGARRYIRAVPEIATVIHKGVHKHPQ